MAPAELVNKEKISVKKDVTFEPVRGGRLSDAVIEQITAQISEGILKVGDQLPSERELIDQFGISRASVRDAIRSLEARGILEVRRGLGTFVTSSRNLNGPNDFLVSWLRENEHKLLEILEVREALETKAAYLAAQRRKEHDVEQMKRVVQEMNISLSEGDLEAATVADRKFHRLLNEASGNRLLVELAENIDEVLHDLRYSTLNMPGRAKMALTEHKPIIDAIKIRDPEQAESAVVVHLNSAKRYIREFLDGVYDGPEEMVASN
jgi:GntR family transcriptional repressor for pyruvate dehydrogenase complex